MKIKEIEEWVPEGMIKSLKKRGIEEFTPPQKKSINSGLLKGSNLTVSSPTASGKTLVASLAFVKNIIERDGKAVYIVPLRSLASEKYKKFKKWYGELGIDVAISIGNYDSADPWLKDKDLIIVTSEKLDSLIRHGSNWVKDINTVIIDEVHLLNDKSRGPNLEILITRLKELVPEAQYIALSATINNDEELSDWLNSKLVKSNYRPVELEEGILFKKRIRFKDKEERTKSKRSKPTQNLIEDTLRRDKQALVFLSTRRSTESVAEKGKKIVKDYLNTPEKKKLFKIGEKVKNVLESPTSQCKKLSKCVKNGIAFHHAGLMQKQKELIEDAFRDRLVKIICCTPTLSYGVSIPADRTIIRDLKRFSPEQGRAVWIPVLEYQQFCGRAGRPEYSSEGEAISVAKKQGKKEEIEERYVNGEPEDILSKLAVKPILRMHVLALVASGFVRTREQLKDFFSKTLYWYQYKNEKLIENKIGSVLQKLINFDFIKNKNKKLKPTKIGKRISELYIDPLTGKNLIESIKKSKEEKTTPFSFIFMISNTLELQPWLKINKRNHSQIESKLVKKEDEIIEEPPSQWDYEYQRFLKAFRLSLMFEDWVNELDEEKIMKKYGVAPGSLRSKLYNADWLLYSSKELANLLGVKSILKDLTKLRIRMKKGVRKELLDLVKLDQIGRVRARKLYKRGIKTTKDIKEVPYDRLSDILGSAIAAKAKKQVGVDIEEEGERKIGLEKFM